jgi:signal peptidase I
VRTALKPFLRYLLVAIGSAALTVGVFHFVLQPFEVMGLSMAPTLEDRDYLLVDRLFFKERGLRRGDIVVFRLRDGSPFLVKRVVGIPGDTLSIRDGLLFVNGRPQGMPELKLSSVRPFGPASVPPGRFFCLGDNGPSSKDSRTFGPIPLDRIYGRAVYRYLPLGRSGPISER